MYFSIGLRFCVSLICAFSFTKAQSVYFIFSKTHMRIPDAYSAGWVKMRMRKIRSAILAWINYILFLGAFSSVHEQIICTELLQNFKLKSIFKILESLPERYQWQDGSVRSIKLYTLTRIYSLLKIIKKKLN